MENGGSTSEVAFEIGAALGAALSIGNLDPSQFDEWFNTKIKAGFIDGLKTQL